MTCPKCNSVLYERGPGGWSCSTCGYRKAHEDSEVLVTKPGRHLHGNVWGQVRHPRERFNNGPFKVIRVGSLERFCELYQSDKSAALKYLQTYEFKGKKDLNRHYLAAKLCLELGKVREAQKHIAICRSRLGQARDTPSRYRVLDLSKRIQQKLDEEQGGEAGAAVAAPHR